MSIIVAVCDGFHCFFFTWRLSVALLPTLFVLTIPTLKRYGFLLTSCLGLAGVCFLYWSTHTSPLDKLSLLQRQFRGESVESAVTSPPDLSSQWHTLYSLQPNHRDLLINLGRSLLNKGESATAQPYLETAQQLDPNFVDPTAK